MLFICPAGYEATKIIFTLLGLPLINAPAAGESDRGCQSSSFKISGNEGQSVVSSKKRTSKYQGNLLSFRSCIPRGFRLTISGR